MEIVESVFSFDYVGDQMMAVRTNLDAVELQKDLVQALIPAALSKANDNSPEAVAAITKASEARVKQYVTSSKSSRGTGCGG
ncbi:MAG: hypothetical protein JW967_00370, partial [Dehalococcoidales bacterium]|nr:hypothetical protein [Dehalococcoidales bacterium]